MFSQTFSNWTLRVRDDGSSDGTVELIRAAARDDPRIELVEDDLGNLGPADSFMALLATIGPDDDLFAFCDQDDVWRPDKLTASVAALADTPIAAVYTDAEVTDAVGRVISPSAMADRGARGAVPFGHLLINNAAIGATLLGTAALAGRAVALAADEPVLMHDWWVALVAGHQGTLTALPTPTLQWRRHEGTVTGSRPATWRGRAERRRHYVGWSIGAARRLAAVPAPRPRRGPGRDRAGRVGRGSPVGSWACGSLAHGRSARVATTWSALTTVLGERGPIAPITAVRGPTSCASPLLVATMSPSEGLR